MICLLLCSNCTCPRENQDICAVSWCSHLKILFSCSFYQAYYIYLVSRKIRCELKVSPYIVQFKIWNTKAQRPPCQHPTICCRELGMIQCLYYKIDRKKNLTKIVISICSLYPDLNIILTFIFFIALNISFSIFCILNMFMLFFLDQNYHKGWNYIFANWNSSECHLVIGIL